MEKTKKYVNVYTESNPNPNSLKFVVNFMLCPETLSFDYPTLEEAKKNSPLAEGLFEEFEHVDRVFVSANFLTITKKDGIEWNALARPLKNYLQTYLENDNKIFSEAHIKKNTVIVESDSDDVKQIKSILDEYIRPAVESDGGAITFHSFDTATGIVTVMMQGACSGCPSSSITLKAGIENLLKQMMPDKVTEVVAQNL